MPVDFAEFQSRLERWQVGPLACCERSSSQLAWTVSQEHLPAPRLAIPSAAARALGERSRLQLRLVLQTRHFPPLVDHLDESQPKPFPQGLPMLRESAAR